MSQKIRQPQEELTQPEEDEQEVNKVEEEKKDEINVTKSLPFHKLLSYADAWDWSLMALGTLGSVVHGMAQPIGYLLLGKALNAFGDNIGDTRAMVNALYKVYIPRTSCLSACVFVYIYMHDDGLFLLFDH